MSKGAIEFETWLLPDLRKFLMAREVPVCDHKKDTLVRHCYAAVMLGLKSKASPDEQSKAVTKTIADKLLLDGGVIHLPEPSSLKDGWEDCLPTVTQTGVESYFDRSE